MAISLRLSLIASIRGDTFPAAGTQKGAPMRARRRRANRARRLSRRPPLPAKPSAPLSRHCTRRARRRRPSRARRPSCRRWRRLRRRRRSRASPRSSRGHRPSRRRPRRVRRRRPSCLRRRQEGGQQSLALKLASSHRPEGEPVPGTVRLTPNSCWVEVLKNREHLGKVEVVLTEAPLINTHLNVKL